MGRIQGVVLISGANRGVGLELTRALLASDHVTRVYAGCRNIEKAENLRTLQDPHKKLRIVDLDVSKDWSIKNVVESVTKESGQINVLVNNAAILEKDHKAGIPDGDRGVWLRHFDINIVSHAMMIQECLPLLRKSIAHDQPATVINISGRKGSIELCPGTERVHGNYAYMCSKTALNHLTRILSIEHSDILTVSMCPGWNRTDMGGAEGMKDPSETAPVLLSTVDSMTIPEHSGKFWDRKGRPIPY
ncbi:oxidoreductase, short chain dehydrogenase/reductase family protein [Necator americanus]|uniref:Oxidoreductase, short chain dehydrogenase/reductase family protein n=1 Tax=Necator americanus TaxID=51031 RepID=W2U091_NECAM|nr:oxidoreductase, short chain dehydrogenase/reductase family protein [Necator americanus]ETN86717.1 oxidoreductase, short chain dehydrogenase/reductase family protein [Necator americanus]